MEKIETINNFLRDNFGVDTVTGQVMYRVVWADDQFENRMSKFTPSGVLMLQETMQWLPKYSWCKGFYILEKLQITPDVNLKELGGKKIDYNILHKFMGADELPVPPAIWACKFLIDTVNAAMGRGSLAKYVKADDDPNAPITNAQDNYEYRKQQLDQIQNELYGNESGLQGQTLNSGSAIIVPPGYNKEN